jgi:hypothetical protein
MFYRCLKYAKEKNKFSIDQMRLDLDLDNDEAEMLLREHILKNYFPRVKNNDNKTTIEATRMLSLYGRGVYFSHQRTEQSLRMSQIALYAAVAAFIASMVGAVAELLDLAVVDSVKITEVDESLLR